MEKFDPSPHIKNSFKITDIFGYWPAFQDAEIHELRLTVADAEPWVAGSESPALEMLLLVFERTDDLTPEGRFILTKHTLVRLRFCKIAAVQLSDFWYKNCVSQIDFGIESMKYARSGSPEEESRPVLLRVEIESTVGLSGKFTCQSAEVISTEPCDENGKSAGSAA